MSRGYRLCGQGVQGEVSVEFSLEVVGVERGQPHEHLMHQGSERKVIHLQRTQLGDTHLIAEGLHLATMSFLGEHFGRKVCRRATEGHRNPPALLPRARTSLRGRSGSFASGDTEVSPFGSLVSFVLKCVEDSGDAEVGELDVAGGIDQNILWLQVPAQRRA